MMKRKQEIAEIEQASHKRVAAIKDNKVKKIEHMKSVAKHQKLR